MVDTQSGDEYDSSDGWSTVSESLLGSDGPVETASFPQFERLPIELRLYFWELFCLEYTSSTLTLEFIVYPLLENAQDLENVQYYTVYNTEHLRYSTRAIRTALAVCHECRYIVTRTLTDTLTFRTSRNHSMEGLVRFRRDRDIVFLRDFTTPRDTHVLYHLPNFAECVEKVAIKRRSISRTGGRLLDFLTNLSTLSNVFIRCTAASSRFDTESLKWFTSTSCHQKRNPLGREETIYCWPKQDKESEIPDIPTEYRLFSITISLYGWKMCPMVTFKGRHGIENYDRLVNMELDFERESGSDSEESGNLYHSFTSSEVSATFTEIRRRRRREKVQKRARAVKLQIEARRAQRRAAWKVRWEEQQLGLLEAELGRL